jgi:hypothetical protein
MTTAKEVLGMVEKLPKVPKQTYDYSLEDDEKDEKNEVINFERLKQP